MTGEARFVVPVCHAMFRRGVPGSFPLVPNGKLPGCPADDNVLAPVIALDPGTIRLADPLIVNEHEAGRALLQLGADSPGPGADPLEHGRALGRALLDTGLASVIVTLGSKGAAVGEADGVGLVPAHPVDAVDTTGAGDALVGVIAAGLARGMSLL